jgi:hypothetical protein
MPIIRISAQRPAETVPDTKRPNNVKVINAQQGRIIQNYKNTKVTLFKTNAATGNKIYTILITVTERTRLTLAKRILLHNMNNYLCNQNIFQ